MGWFQTHRRAYSKALLAGHGPAGPPQPYPSQSYPSQLYPSQLYPSQPYPGGHGRRGEKRCRESSEPLGQEEEEEEEEEEDSDSEEGEPEVECDVSNMEITEELRQYFAQTERHREELSK